MCTNECVGRYQATQFPLRLVSEVTLEILDLNRTSGRNVVRSGKIQPELDARLLHGRC